jgi:hypothetical protein
VRFGACIGPIYCAGSPGLFAEPYTVASLAIMDAYIAYWHAIARCINVTVTILGCISLNVSYSFISGRPEVAELPPGSRLDLG